MRVARIPGGQLCLERGPRRIAGRGAYLCTAERCMGKAQRALQRALGVPVTDELLNEIKEQAETLRCGRQSHSMESDA